MSALRVPPAHIHQLAHPVRRRHRHQLPALPVVGRVKRDGDIYLGHILSKAQNLRQQAAGGYRNIPQAETQTVFIVQDLNSPDQLLIIVERFAGSHHDDVTDSLARIPAHGGYLIDDLPCAEVALQAVDARCAESASHPAAGLR